MKTVTELDRQCRESAGAVRHYSALGLLYPERDAVKSIAGHAIFTKE